jgi:hypothetical protein
MAHSTGFGSRGTREWVMDSDAVGERTVARGRVDGAPKRSWRASATTSCGRGAQRCCARTMSVANVEVWAGLHLNPATWETIAATGWVR